MVAVRIVVRGVVQGVFFRQSMRSEADTAGVSGWVRNLADGRVEAVVEGRPEAVDALVAWSRSGPSRAVVTDVDVREIPVSGVAGFRVRSD